MILFDARPNVSFYYIPGMTTSNDSDGHDTYNTSEPFEDIELGNISDIYDTTPNNETNDPSRLFNKYTYTQ